MDYQSKANVVAALGGVTAHLLVFRRGEWDMEARYIFIGHLVAIAGACTMSDILMGISSGAMAGLAGCYIGGLYLSMLLYRAFFHRLSKYPGPFLARLSNFYVTALSVKKLHLFAEVQELHSQYGDYVRLGPSELSIADPEAVQAVYSSRSPTTKGPWYNIMEPRVTLQMSRDRAEHARRRKVWDLGFTTKAINGYEHRVTKAVKELVHVIDRDHEKPINIALWFNYFSFDVMEDLAFNKNANMVKNGQGDYVFTAIRDTMWDIAFFRHLPWLLPFPKRIPIMNNDYLKFWDWVQNQIDERRENEPDQPDIFSWVLEAYNKTSKSRRDRYDLHGDAQLIVVAGSDTVAAALTCTFYELAHDQAHLRALQKQFDALPNLEHENLLHIDLLEAIINESMRLHPPVPSGTQRVTPPEGLAIGDVHIPGGTIVTVPSHTVFRDARSFEHPNEFIPERWTTRPDLIKNKSVFIPFSIGPYACVGKRLAMLEIRRVMAEVLSRYDIAVPPDHSKEEFLDGKQDTFTLVSAPLPLVFTPRSLNG